MRQIALIFSVCLKFSSVLWLCAAVLCCDPELKELSSVQWVNSKELVFTWLSRCCYGREARQRRKKPLSLRLSHIPIFALARSLFLLLCSLVLSLPESLAGWKTKRLMRVHSSRSLLLFIFQITFPLSFAPSLWNTSLSSLHLPISPLFCLSPSFCLCFSLLSSSLSLARPLCNIRNPASESCTNSTRPGWICQSFWMLPRIKVKMHLKTKAKKRSTHITM